MLRHVVLIKWKQGVTSDQIATVAQGFARLREVIPNVIALNAGRDLQLMPGTFDFAMVADFETSEDWQIYRDHPEHLAFASRFGSWAEQAARVQFLV